ncbi:MAG: hypothetical protein COA79_25245 [Planctomycetota bacterium]|nr:MAG: hypothetical protein COA79_25245 [Planctomycetota bacterium]
MIHKFFLIFGMLIFLTQLKAGEEIKRTWVAPPLPAPKGEVIRVSNVDALKQAVNKLKDGQTLLLEDGIYQFKEGKLKNGTTICSSIWLSGKKNISIRSASGKPEKVILRGCGWDSDIVYDNILQIADCENVLVAGITFEEAHLFGVHVVGHHKPKNIHIYNCIFRNIGTRSIKGSAAGAGKNEFVKVVDGMIEYCWFENTKVPPTGQGKKWLFNGNYISSLDMMGLHNWTIQKNVFLNIKGSSREGRAAIFVWNQCKNITIKDNLIIDCDRGVSLGNYHRGKKMKEGAKHVDGALVYNNIIVPGPADAGVEIMWSANILIAHNTIWQKNGKRGIRFLHALPGTKIINNIIRGVISKKQEGVEIINNITGEAGLFKDAKKLHFQLLPTAKSAIAQGLPLDKVKLDYYGKTRSKTPSIGAIE